MLTRQYRRLATGLMALLVVVIAGCGSTAGPEDDPGRLVSGDTEVRPGRAMAVIYNLNSQDLVATRSWYEDTNTNQAYVDSGLRQAGFPVTLLYDKTGAPDKVAKGTADAVTRAAGAWSTAVGGTRLFSLRSSKKRLLPVQDGVNAVSWCTGAEAGLQWFEIARATVWSLDGVITEADIVLNRDLPWLIGGPIQPGDPAMGTDLAFDVQGAVTHQLGHLLGLDVVAADQGADNGDEADATMFGWLLPGSLIMQTLTPGDVAGAKLVTGVK